MIGQNKNRWLFISILIAINLFTAVILSNWEDKAYIILGIIFCVSAFNIFIIGKKLCLYKETSPQWLKISISIASTIAGITLVYLLISIFAPALPFVDIIDIICEASLIAAVLLVLVERIIFGVKDDHMI